MPTLHWLNKDKTIKEAKKVSYRILKENKNLSYGNDTNTENMIIKGDNLEVLKSLLPYYTGKVKCIYIDPPYNTGNIFEHYNDNLEHSIWLNMMYPRLELIKQLLAEDGVIFVQIDHSPSSFNNDSSEAPYLQIILDEIFGRKNYITNIIWKKKGNPSNTSTTIGTITESIFVYCKNNNKVVFYKETFEKKYKYRDNYGEYNLEKFLKTDEGEYKRDTMKFEIKDKNTNKIYLPPTGKRWTYGKESIDRFIQENLIIFKNDNVYIKKYKNDNDNKIFKNLLLEHGSLKTAKDELEKLGFERESFDTPKPEILLKTILEMSTKPHDLILDCFLGSGTTAAVAHKMNRKYIGIELGDHAITHVVPRLKKVIDGSDQGGISKSVDWKGGGGYKFYELGETIFDEKGKIRLNIDFNTLANHIWFSETGTSSSNNNFVNNVGVDGKTALLGIYKNTAYILLYNGILKDKRPIEGNVLTNKVLNYLKELLNGSSYTNMIIYGDACKVRREVLEQNKIIFKQIPYDVKGK